MCFSEKNGLKSAFLRQRLPLSFSLYLKMDNGSFQKLFPKNFFDLIQPGVQAFYFASEANLASASRARGEKKVKIAFYFLVIIFMHTTIF